MFEDEKYMWFFQAIKIYWIGTGPSATDGQFYIIGIIQKGWEYWQNFHGVGEENRRHRGDRLILPNLKESSGYPVPFQRGPRK